MRCPERPRIHRVQPRARRLHVSAMPLFEAVEAAPQQQQQEEEEEEEEKVSSASSPTRTHMPRGISPMTTPPSTHKVKQRIARTATLPPRCQSPEPSAPRSSTWHTPPPRSGEKQDLLQQQLQARPATTAGVAVPPVKLHSAAAVAPSTSSNSTATATATDVPLAAASGAGASSSSGRKLSLTSSNRFHAINSSLGSSTLSRLSLGDSGMFSPSDFVTPPLQPLELLAEVHEGAAVTGVAARSAPPAPRRRTVSAVPRQGALQRVQLALVGDGNDKGGSEHMDLNSTDRLRPGQPWSASSLAQSLEGEPTSAAALATSAVDGGKEGEEGEEDAAVSRDDDDDAADDGNGGGMDGGGATPPTTTPPTAGVARRRGTVTSAQTPMPSMRVSRMTARETLQAPHTHHHTHRRPRRRRLSGAPDSDGGGGGGGGIGSTGSRRHKRGHHGHKHHNSHGHHHHHGHKHHHHHRHRTPREDVTSSPIVISPTASNPFSPFGERTRASVVPGGASGASAAKRRHRREEVAAARLSAALGAATGGGRSRLSRYLQDFEEVGVIGRGAYCNVFKCIRRIDGCPYAIKCTTHEVHGRRAREAVRREVLALAALADCPFVVRYHSAWEEDSTLYIQLELCSGSLAGQAWGSVRSKALAAPVAVSQEEPLEGEGGEEEGDGDGGSGPGMSFEAWPETRLLTVLYHIAQALWCMHSRGMAHLDVKPANMLQSRVPDTAANTPLYSPEGPLFDQSGGGAGAGAGGGLRMVRRSSPGAPSSHGQARSWLAPAVAVVYKLGDLGQVAALAPEQRRGLEVAEGDARYLSRWAGLCAV